VSASQLAKVAPQQNEMNKNLEVFDGKKYFCKSSIS
jgi:hypothetical protein